MVDPTNIGRNFPAFSFTIERGKVWEFLLAIGDKNPAFMDLGSNVPPTFATVFEFWGGEGLEGMLKELGVEIWNVLHAEQEYEYFMPLHSGDTVTGHASVANIYTKAGMQFLEVETEYKNQDGKLVLTGRALIIVRE